LRRRKWNEETDAFKHATLSPEGKFQALDVDEKKVELPCSIDAGTLLGAVRSQQIFCWEYDAEKVALKPTPEQFDKYKKMFAKGVAMGFETHFTLVGKGASSDPASFRSRHVLFGLQLGQKIPELREISSGGFNFIATPKDDPSVLKFSGQMGESNIRCSYDL